MSLIDEFRSISAGANAAAKGLQLVNTDGIEAAAIRLNDLNDQISGDFDAMVKQANRLETDWKSAAGSLACTKMYELFKNSEVRYSVLKNYVNMLNQQVSPGYKSAENANTTLADQFK